METNYTITEFTNGRGFIISAKELVENSKGQCSALDYASGSNTWKVHSIIRKKDNKVIRLGNTTICKGLKGIPKIVEIIINCYTLKAYVRLHSIKYNQIVPIEALISKVNIHSPLNVIKMVEETGMVITSTPIKEVKVTIDPNMVIDPRDHLFLREGYRNGLYKIVFIPGKCVFRLQNIRYGTLYRGFVNVNPQNRFEFTIGNFKKFMPPFIQAKDFKMIHINDVYNNCFEL